MKMLVDGSAEGGSSEYAQYPRAEGSYNDESARFLLPRKDKSFSRQYAHIYFARLCTMRPRLVEAAHFAWGRDVPVRRLSELKTDEQCIVIGTLFKSMSLKPSVLRELSDEHGLTPQPLREKYVDESSDRLCLEDELQRITLIGGEMDIGMATTGVVVAVYGVEPSTDAGRFHVKHVTYQPLPDQIPRSSMSSDDRFVVFVSGLEISPSLRGIVTGGGGAGQGEGLGAGKGMVGGGSDPLALQILVDLITGQIGDNTTQLNMSKVVRVIVAGNSLSRDTRDRDHATRAKYLNKKSSVGTKEAVTELDHLLAELAACVPVDLMPGEFDPTTFTLPQQPLHRCLFPRAARYNTMNCVSNPYDCSMEGVRILGTSGQPVQDIYRYTTMTDHLKILEGTLLSGHLAPTAPDTLACYPYADRDPFVLDVTPHIYFTGNSPKLQHKLLDLTSPIATPGSVPPKPSTSVLLLAVPRFSTTRSCVSVNLRTLECHEIKIDAGCTPLPPPAVLDESVTMVASCPVISFTPDLSDGDDSDDNM